MRVSRRIASFFALVALVCSGWTTPRAAQESAAQTLPVAGLRERVTVHRDERGIPYIQATNADDLYFAQGYITASDRLWQMDLLRRTAAGELSEIFGKRTVEEDKKHRTFGFARVAEETAAKLSPSERESLDAYARGVNAYIASLTDKTLPLEFRVLQYRPRPWRPADTFLIGKLFAETLSTSWPVDIHRTLIAGAPAAKRTALLPESSGDDVLVVGSDDGPARPRNGNKVMAKASAAIVRETAAWEASLKSALSRVGLHAEELAASNNWVVSGARTATGKPLLANDPHLDSSAPSIWHMVHLSMPGLRVAGVTSPGIPGVLIGHNERIAWGCTNMGPDVQDLFVETFDPKNPTKYKTPTGWAEADIRREEIKVRKTPTSPETETETIEVTVTRHGPIVLDKEGKRYALQWTVLKADPVEFGCYAKLNRARNWDEFREALKDYRGATQNFIYADVDGHIGYYGAGQIPIRKSGDGSVPNDGATAAGDWTGMIPFDELPQVFDPPSGIIVTANSRIAGRSYPYFLSHRWATPHRARRIYNLLTAKDKLTIDDFRATQGDVVSIGGLELAREIVKIGKTVKADDPEWAKLVTMLEAWDGRIVPDSREAVLVTELATVAIARLVGASFGENVAKEYRWPHRMTFLINVLQERPKAWLPKDAKNYADFLATSYREARGLLMKRLGPDPATWTWGNDVKTKFPHPLAQAPLVGKTFAVEPFPQFGAGGLLATPNVGQNVSMRLIADPSNWDATQLGITLGVSGDPTSPHWADQLGDWRAVTPRPFAFSTYAIGRTSKATHTLVPVGK